mgnify:FL=1
MDAIRLLFALDANYLPQLRVLLTSVALNNPGERFELYVMHSGLPESGLERLAEWSAKRGWAFSPVTVDEALFEGAPVTSTYPQEMYYRLLAGRLLPENVDRVLYLDPDILVINPLRALWETDLRGNMFAAAAHTGKTELANNVNRLRLGTDHDYYNSGVLLMDLAACRREISTGELFDFVREHRRELVMPDQDLLNAMYGDSVLPVDDAVWNYDARNYNNYMLRSSGEQNSRWVMQNTSILHFCGKAKPWKPNYIYRFGVLYQHYERLAERDWA